MLLSIIIPVYNESGNVTQLYTLLKQCLKKDFSSFKYEIVFIDDGSSDDTYTLLSTLHKKDAHVKVIQFSRNFGHHIAITAGFDLAKGDYIIVMDGDLQNAPEQITLLYKKLLEGYDMVYAVKKQRNESFFKKIPSVLFWKMIVKLSGLPITPNQMMLRIFTKKVLLSLQEFKEHNRFYAGIFTWIGFKQASVVVDVNKRYSGKSKYSFSKMAALSLNAVFGFSNLPLYYISYIGMTIALLSFIFGAFYVIRKIVFNLGAIGWPTLIFLVSFIGGIIIFSIGVLGIYLSKIYQESMKRPLYITKNKLL